MWAKSRFNTDGGYGGGQALLVAEESLAHKTAMGATTDAITFYKQDYTSSQPVGFISFNINVQGKYYPMVALRENGSWSNLSIYDIFLTKSDDWKTLCKKAGISPPDTLEELVADSAKLAVILGNSSATRFMLMCCTGDFMASAVTSDAFLYALGNSKYKEMVYTNEHWAKFLAMVA